MAEGRLLGKRVVVTGGGGAIGRAAVLRFAGEGARVLCVDIDGSAADATADEARAIGLQVAASGCDVSSLTGAEAMAEVAGSWLGGVDCVYACAGIQGVGDALQLSPEAWDRVLQVNLSGVWLTNRCLLPALIEAGGGSIVNQASVAALVGFPKIAAYAASKAGVVGLTRSIAIDFAPHKVRVNAVCPGTVPTRMVEDTYRVRGLPEGMTYEQALDQSAKRFPLGRLGTTADVVNLALFLLSDESSWVTGQVIAVDGGWTAV